MAVHPTEEALFNLANAWSMMLLPLMLADTKAPRAVNKWGLWVGTMFLTNVFFLPYMALRLGPGPKSEADEKAGRAVVSSGLYLRL